MAEHMDQYHSSFRRTWSTLHSACSANKRPSNLSLAQFLALALSFCAALETHHRIEESHIFPVLATRMPAFRQELELLTQHTEIHAGLERLEAYVGECKRGERELRLREMGEVLDSFGKVLWTHLESEVAQLGAENMRRFWTVEEMGRMPF
jgi:hemerythrin-like domain-containing protein